MLLMRFSAVARLNRWLARERQIASDASARANAEEPVDACDVRRMVVMISGDGRDAEDGVTAADRGAGFKHGAQAPRHALSQLLLRPWRWLRGRQGFELLVDQTDSAPDRRPDGAMLSCAQDTTKP